MCEEIWKALLLLLLILGLICDETNSYLVMGGHLNEGASDAVDGPHTA